MAKMKKDVKREMFRELCQHKEELKNDVEFVQRIINERLAYIPHKKLYKFRSCSINSFKTLEESCIWMSPASSFDDLFDNTINIDLVQNSREIKSWVYNNFPVFCFDLAKSFCESNGEDIPYSHKDFKEYIDTCLDENGNPIVERERNFIGSRAAPYNIDLMDEAFTLLKELRNKFAKT